MIKQEILLRKIFEQAHFYSRGRRKKLCNSLPEGEGATALPEALSIKSKLTFMGYMRHRAVKNRMVKQKSAKGNYLYRNQ